MEIQKNNNVASKIVSTLGLTLFFVLASSQVFATWLSGYNYRREVRIDHAQVSGGTDLTNFPMLFDYTDVQIRSEANGGVVTSASGYDIAFTAADGSTQLDHELVEYTASTGHYIGWVTIPTLSATANTVIYLYYGNSAVTTDPSTADTWDGNFEAVLHLQESGGGTDDEFVDASGNGFHGTGGGIPGAGSAARTPVRAAGKFGYAQEFDDAGDQDQIRLQVIDDDGWTGVTVQAWIYAHDLQDDRIFGKSWGIGTNQQTWLLRKNTAGRAGTRMRTNTNNEGGFDPGAPVPTNTWIMVAVTWDATANQLAVYQNGVQLGTRGLNGATLYNPATTDHATIGNTTTLNRGFDGLIQEVRVSSTARSADWMATEFNNQNDPSTFFRVETGGIFLPVEFTGLHATVENDHVFLDWETESEVNNEFFVVQRSADTRVIQDVVKVMGAGTTSEAKNYSALDTEPLSGTSYYRIKQTDFDGTTTFSDWVTVERKSKEENVKWTVYPNPARVDSPIMLNATLLEEEATREVLIVVQDIYGRVRYSKVVIVGNEPATAVDPAGQLEPGLYVITGSSTHTLFSKRLVVGQ